MPNWWKKQLPNEAPKSRYTFSVEGDIFIGEEGNAEIEGQSAEERITGALAGGEGIRVNSLNVTPYQRVI